MSIKKEQLEQFVNGLRDLAQTNPGIAQEVAAAFQQLQQRLDEVVFYGDERPSEEPKR